jgi:hypothetical protein
MKVKMLEWTKQEELCILERLEKATDNLFFGVNPLTLEKNPSTAPALLRCLLLLTCLLGVWSPMAQVEPLRKRHRPGWARLPSYLLVLSPSRLLIWLLSAACIAAETAHWSHIVRNIVPAVHHSHTLTLSSKWIAETFKARNPTDAPSCPKSFVTSRNLNQHLKVHTVGKPFSCSHCKVFGRLGNLQTHLKVHTGEKPYNCSCCTKSFAQSGSLQLHLRNYSGEKPYSCHQCPKSFSVSSNFE